MAGNNSIQILRGNGQAIENAVMACDNSHKLLDGQPFYNTDKNYLTIGKNVNSFPIRTRELVGYAGDTASIGACTTEVVSIKPDILSMVGNLNYSANQHRFNTAGKTRLTIGELAGLGTVDINTAYTNIISSNVNISANMLGASSIQFSPTSINVFSQSIDINCQRTLSINVNRINMINNNAIISFPAYSGNVFIGNYYDYYNSGAINAFVNIGLNNNGMFIPLRTKVGFLKFISRDNYGVCIYPNGVSSVPIFDSVDVLYFDGILRILGNAANSTFYVQATGVACYQNGNFSFVQLNSGESDSIDAILLKSKNSRGDFVYQAIPLYA